MGTMNNQPGDSDGQDRSSAGQGQPSTGQTDITITKRSAVRQKLAIALMAIGGALVAGLIWYALYGQKAAE